jgi:hypothetical protein
MRVGDQLRIDDLRLEDERPMEIELCAPGAFMPILSPSADSLGHTRSHPFWGSSHPRRWEQHRRARACPVMRDAAAAWTSNRPNR